MRFNIAQLVAAVWNSAYVAVASRLVTVNNPQIRTHFRQSCAVSFAGNGTQDFTLSKTLASTANVKWLLGPNGSVPVVWSILSTTTLRATNGSGNPVNGTVEMQITEYQNLPV